MLIHLLVVEPNPGAQSFIKISLGIKNLELDIVGTAKEAFHAATVKHPDLILSEIKLPDKDGISLFKKFRKTESGKNIPFIFMSYIADKSFILFTSRIGALDYIIKPLEAPILFSTIFKSWKIIHNKKLENSKRNIRFVSVQKRGDMSIISFPITLSQKSLEDFHMIYISKYAESDHEEIFCIDIRNQTSLNIFQTKIIHTIIKIVHDPERIFIIAGRSYGIILEADIIQSNKIFVDQDNLNEYLNRKTFSSS